MGYATNRWKNDAKRRQKTGDACAETQAKHMRRGEEQPRTRTRNTMTKTMRRPKRRMRQSNGVDCPLQGLGRRGEYGGVEPGGAGALHKNFSLGRSFHPPANDFLEQE